MKVLEIRLCLSIPLLLTWVLQCLALEKETITGVSGPELSRMIDKMNGREHLVVTNDDKLFALLKEQFRLEKDVRILFSPDVSENSLKSSKTLNIYEKNEESRECILPPQMTRGNVIPGNNLHLHPDKSLTISSMLGFDYVSSWINEHLGTFRDANGQLLPEAEYAAILNARRKTTSNFDTCSYVDYNDLSPERFFEEFLSRSRPVVIRNGLKNWAPLKQWSIPFLKSTYGKEEVSVRAAPYNDIGVGIFEGCEKAHLWKDANVSLPDFVKERLESPDMVLVRPAILKMSFEDFMNNITIKNSNRNVCYYMEYLKISDFLKPLMEDTNLGKEGYLDVASDLFPHEQTRNLWISDGNTLGKMHFDASENLLSMVKGEKEFVLLPPDCSENLYEGHIREARFRFNLSTEELSRSELMESTSIVNTPVDITNPDLARYPKFDEVINKTLKCQVEESDILYLPAFWWHEVKSRPSAENVNIAVNHWFEPFYKKPFPCKTCSIEVNVQSYRETILKYMSALEKQKTEL